MVISHKLWKITIFTGRTHYKVNKWPMLNSKLIVLSHYHPLTNIPLLSHAHPWSSLLKRIKPHPESMVVYYQRLFPWTVPLHPLSHWLWAKAPLLIMRLLRLLLIPAAGPYDPAEVARGWTFPCKWRIGGLRWENHPSSMMEFPLRCLITGGCAEFMFVNCEEPSVCSAGSL